MNDIFTYTDYRVLLKDYYESCKAKTPWFSYECFSRKAGISSKGLLYNVISGRRRLSPLHIAGVAAAMKLNENQFAYFRTLVACNNYGVPSGRQRLFEPVPSIQSLVPTMS